MGVESRLPEQQGRLRDQSRWVTSGDCRGAVEVHSDKDRKGFTRDEKESAESPAALKVPPPGFSSPQGPPADYQLRMDTI